MWKLKQAVALIVLAVSSYSDIKERQIYVMPLVIGVIFSIAVSIADYMIDPIEHVNEVLFGSLIFPLFCSVFVFLIISKLKDYIGIGDAYLFAFLSFALGVSRNIRIICFASLVAGLLCAILILLNMDKKWKKVPFAPFLLTGYMCLVCAGSI